MTVWQLLRQRMAGYGSRLAIAGEPALTYAELITEAERRATALKSRAGKLCLVGGSTKRETSLNLLAALAAGCVAVPEGKAYEREEWTADLVRSDCASYPGIALLLFTGGTTGTPKGVLLGEAGIAANLLAVSQYFPVQPDDRLAVVRPVEHASAIVGEFFLALYAGAEVVFYEEPFQPRRLMRFLKEREITVLCATPTVFGLLGEEDTAGCPLRLASVSGECLSPAAALRLAKAFPGTAFYNAYGLTEHSPRVSVLPPAYFTAKPGSIGLPLSGTKMKLVNGELWVKSPSVMAGYYKDEQATAEKLKEGWLKTGDAAERDADGFYYIRGRMDGMIIRGGVNIYPQEIESALVASGAARECLVWGERDERLGGEKICLAAVTDLERGELVRRVRALLPGHLQPQRIEAVQSLPSTAAGKLRRGEGHARTDPGTH